MPSADLILESLSMTAHRYEWLAMMWHATLLAALLLALLDILPLLARRLAVFASLPLVSVAVVASIDRSPLNAVAFGLLTLLSLRAALRIEPKGRVTRGPLWAVAAGSAALLYAASYHHFSQTPHDWVAQLARSPVGLLPCPTLAAVMGLGMLANSFGSRAWGVSVSLWGVFYALFGVMHLSVALDVGLLLVSLAMLVVAMVAPARQHPRRRDELREERLRIESFLGLSRIALIGASTDPQHFSRMMLEQLTARGIEVVPIHPSAPEIAGRKAFAHVADVTPKVEGALIMTPAKRSAAVVEECLAAGVGNIWLHRGAGPGAVSEEAARLAIAGGASLVSGRCPLMFLGHPPEMVHRVHGALVRLGGHYPARIKESQA